MKCMYPKPECQAGASAKGLCSKHYQLILGLMPLSWKSLYRLGWASPDNQNQFICKAPDCVAVTHYAKGYCAAHYQRAKYTSIAPAANPTCVQEVRGKPCGKPQGAIQGVALLGKTTGRVLCVHHWQEEFEGREIPTVVTPKA